MNANRKHTIIHGSPCTGKSIVAKLLVSNRNALIIDARSPKIFENHFLLGSATKETTTIVFTDVNTKHSPYDFFQFMEEVKIDEKFQERFYLKDLEIIIEYSDFVWGLQYPPETIARRFAIINTDKISLKKLAQFLDVRNLKEHSKYYKP